MVTSSLSPSVFALASCDSCFCGRRGAACLFLRVGNLGALSDPFLVAYGVSVGLAFAACAYCGCRTVFCWPPVWAMVDLPSLLALGPSESFGGFVLLAPAARSCGLPAFCQSCAHPSSVTCGVFPSCAGSCRCPDLPCLVSLPSLYAVGTQRTPY